MKNTIFCKYNNNRNPKFQTRTSIIIDGDRKYIEKKAVNESGINHIKKFEDDYELSKKIYANLWFVPPIVCDDKVEYPYIEGTPIEEIYKGDDNNSEEIISFTKEIIEKYIKPSEDIETKYIKYDEFLEFFGDVDCSEEICIKPCNIDMIFDNIVIAKGVPVVYDYEWVFDFPIPKDYVIYRILCRVYSKRFDVLVKNYSLEEFVEQFDIDLERQKKFRSMEDHFMEYVFNDGDIAFSNEHFLTQRNNLSDYSFYKNGYNQAVDLLHKTEDKLRDTEVVLHSTEEDLIENINKNSALCAKIDKLEKQYIIKDTRKTRLEENNKYLNNKVDIINEQLRQSDEYINGLEGQISLLTNSISWKLTKPLRFVKRFFTRSYNNDSINDDNMGVDQAPIVNKFPVTINAYIEEQSKSVSAVLKETNHRISIITPLYNTPKEYLIEMIESVVSQTSPFWELCLADFSDDGYEYIDEICGKYSVEDERIIYKSIKKNRGIAINSNICESLSSGDYIAVLDHDDVLHKSAISEAINAIVNDNADFVYTDEAKFSNSIDDVDYVNIKPDFSVDELRAHNFICHFNVFKKTLFEDVCGYKSDFDGSQDHDLVLRLTENAENIVHIPRVLYYWRVHSESVSQNIAAKPYAVGAGEKAVTEQLHRYGLNQYAKSVNGIIPLYRIYSENTHNDNYTIVIWGHNTEAEFESEAAFLKRFKDIKVIDAEKSYNDFDYIMDKADSNFVLFVRSGLYVDYESFFKELSIYSDRDDIASIDSKVLDSDLLIMSGGAYFVEDDNMPLRVRGMGGGTNYVGYENAQLYSRTVSCSLGLCTAIKKSAWLESEKNYTYNSIVEGIVLFSYNSLKRGFSNIIIPYYEVSDVTDKIKDNLIECINNIKIDGKSDPYFNDDIINLKLE